MVVGEHLDNRIKIICNIAILELQKIRKNSINLICIDPPYVGIINKEWDKKNQLTDELINEFYRVLKDTGSIYCFCGIGEKSNSLFKFHNILGQKFYFKDLITWKKNRGIGMRKGWLYTREEILWFVKDNKKFIWNKKEQYSNEKRPFTITGAKNLSEYKRITNVWIDINEVGFGSSPKKYSSFRKHLTPKPVELIERIIKLHTKKNDMVLDCFAGSGTTGEACKNLNRKCILIEKERQCIPIIKQRLK